MDIFFKERFKVIYLFVFIPFLTLIFTLPSWADPGTLKWDIQKGNRIESCPAITGDGIIYFGSDDNNLYAINPDGSQKWRFQTGDIIRTAPAVSSSSVVYTCSYDGFLYALNTADGSEKWRFQTQGSLRASPSIGSDNIIYIGSDDSFLYAVNPDGTKNGSFKQEVLFNHPRL